MIQSTLTPYPDSETCTLDCSFCYDPYKPPKRISIKDTEKGTFRETSVPLIKHGNTTFDFRMTVTCSVKEKIVEMFNSGDDFTFAGDMG